MPSFAEGVVAAVLGERSGIVRHAKTLKTLLSDIS